MSGSEQAFCRHHPDDCDGSCCWRKVPEDFVAAIERDALRETIEIVCSYLMEVGGWSEIEGDGDEGYIIVQHIADLLTRAKAGEL